MRQESNRAWPAQMGKFQQLTVPDKPKNLLQRDAWLGLAGESSEELLLTVNGF